ncbi:DUF3987 domain-containing protein [Alphaproteobacteria bacterium]|nr:DUF3987 domain-containing protein [Alphaproteobacteria bacterium]
MHLTSFHIRFSRGHNKYDNKPEQRQCADFEEFEQAVLNDVSQAKGQTFICSPLRSGAHYQKPDKNPGENTWRLRDYVALRQFIAFDFDGFSAPEAFKTVKAFMKRYRGFGYTTASHTDVQPRARIILLANRPMSRDECVAVSEAIQGQITKAAGLEAVQFDNSVYRGEQPIYTPVVGAKTFSFNGSTVDVDACLNPVPFRKSVGNLGDTGSSYVEPDTVSEGERNSAILSYTGHLRAKGEYEDILIQRVHEFNMTKCRPPLDDEEVEDLLDRYPEQRNLRPSQMANNEWPDPKEIKPALKPVPAFDLEMLPDTFKPYVADVSELMDTPADLLAIPLMVATAATLGNAWCIAPKEKDMSWMVTPVLWGAIVAPPGAKKSPCLAKALMPLKAIEERLASDHQLKLQQHQADLLIYDAAMKRAKGNAAKGHPVQNVPVKPECPEAERLMTNDTTYQKLGDILHWSPRGVAVIQDELVGLLEGMNAKGQESSRAFYLSGWNGDIGFNVDRIGRPSNVIPRLALYVLGGMQPDKLQHYVRQATHGGSKNDGLMQRFQLLTYPDMPTTWNYVDRTHDHQAADDVLNAVLRLRDLKPTDVNARSSLDGQYVYLKFADDAQPVFIEAMRGFETAARKPGVPPSIRSHFEKYPRLVAALALIIHLVDGGVGPVSLTATQKALAWAKYLTKHALRVYASADNMGATAAGALADKLKNGALRSGFARRELERKKWHGLSCKEDVDAALEFAVSANWLQEETTASGDGSRSQVYIINPKALAQ